MRVDRTWGLHPSLKALVLEQTTEQETQAHVPGTRQTWCMYVYLLAHNKHWNPSMSLVGAGAAFSNTATTTTNVSYQRVYLDLITQDWNLARNGIGQNKNWTTTLCMVGVDAGNAVTPSTGSPTSDGVLYILHMGDGTIPTVGNN